MWFYKAEHDSLVCRQGGNQRVPETAQWHRRCDSPTQAEAVAMLLANDMFQKSIVSPRVGTQAAYLLLAISSRTLFVARTAGGTSILLACLCLASTNMVYNTVWQETRTQHCFLKRT